MTAKSTALACAFAAVAISGAASAIAAPLTFSPDPNHTFVRFSYQHMNFSIQESRFDKTTGTVTYDPQAKKAAVDLTIDAKSVDTGSALFNEHIQGADFLDTAEFPTATFKSTSVKFNGDVAATIDGMLTLKGVTRPVTLMVTDFRHGMNMMKKDAIGADATAKIKRSDFKMDKYVPMVSDEVTLSIAIEAAAP